MLTPHRAAWLLGRLEGAFAPAGREGVGGYLMSGGGGLAQLAAALCPRRTDAHVLLLQAAVRRVLQRGMRVCEVCVGDGGLPCMWPSTLLCVCPLTSLYACVCCVCSCCIYCVC